MVFEQHRWVMGIPVLRLMDVLRRGGLGVRLLVCMRIMAMLIVSERLKVN
ncbi:hypothetical protein [Vulcanisaeta distributa]|nr:hypothetical protein [Vulcanisaeta distributa]